MKAPRFKIGDRVCLKHNRAFVFTITDMVYGDTSMPPDWLYSGIPDGDYRVTQNRWHDNWLSPILELVKTR